MPQPSNNEAQMPMRAADEGAERPAEPSQACGRSTDGGPAKPREAKPSELKKPSEAKPSNLLEPSEAKTSDLLKIGEFARLAGTNLRTLRYYEELGLLVPSHRSEGGFRYYRPADAHRLHLIHSLQDLGLALERIATFLPARSTGPRGEVCLEAVRSVLLEHERLLVERQAEIDAQRARVAGALERLKVCAEECDRSPSAANDWCSVCAFAGTRIPDLLSALF